MNVEKASPELLRMLDKAIARNLMAGNKTLPEGEAYKPYTTDDCSALFLVQEIVKRGTKYEIIVTSDSVEATVMNSANIIRGAHKSITFSKAVSGATREAFGIKLEAVK